MFSLSIASSANSQITALIIWELDLNLLGAVIDLTPGSCRLSLEAQSMSVVRRYVVSGEVVFSIEYAQCMDVLQDAIDWSLELSLKQSVLEDYEIRLKQHSLYQFTPSEGIKGLYGWNNPSNESHSNGKRTSRVLSDVQISKACSIPVLFWLVSLNLIQSVFWPCIVHCLLEILLWILQLLIKALRNHLRWKTIWLHWIVLLRFSMIFWFFRVQCRLRICFGLRKIPGDAM